MGYKDREQQRAYQREWMQRRRQIYFAGKSCVDCGATEKLQLDHNDREKKADHRIWSWSPARRDAELAKCSPRCEACHLKKTIRERGQEEIAHGKKRGYKRGCRCAPCKAANAFRSHLAKIVARDRLIHKYPRPPRVLEAEAAAAELRAERKKPAGSVLPAERSVRRLS